MFKVLHEFKQSARDFDNECIYCKYSQYALRESAKVTSFINSTGSASNGAQSFVKSTHSSSNHVASDSTSGSVVNDPLTSSTGSVPTNISAGGG